MSSNLPPEEMTAQVRRQTPTERLHEVTMAYAQRSASPPEHSVTISRNAKGVAQFEVTVRGYDVRECMIDAQYIYSTIASAHPYPDANGGIE